MLHSQIIYLFILHLWNTRFCLCYPTKKLYPLWREPDKTVMPCQSVENHSLHFFHFQSGKVKTKKNILTNLHACFYSLCTHTGTCSALNILGDKTWHTLKVWWRYNFNCLCNDDLKKTWQMGTQTINQSNNC